MKLSSGELVAIMEIKLTPTTAQELQVCPHLFQQKYLKHSVTIPSYAINASAQMGTNVHAALDVFYKRGAHQVQSQEDLLALFNHKWSSAGFVDGEQELGYRQQARTMVSAYYSLTLDEPKCQQRMTESFQKTARPLTLGRHKVMLSGRFDRLDLLADGTVEVIDYKTGDPAGGLPDEREMAENLANLVYYRLAVEVYPNAKTVTVSRFFLKSKRKVSVYYTPTRLQSAKAELTQLLNQLDDGIAPPHENFGCAWCLVRKHGQCPLFAEVDNATVEALAF